MYWPIKPDLIKVDALSHLVWDGSIALWLECRTLNLEDRVSNNFVHSTLLQFTQLCK